MRFIWQGRCAAVALLQNVLAVLPAVETDVLEAQLAAGGARAPAGGLPATVASSYIIQLGKLGIKEARPCGGMGRACAWGNVARTQSEPASVLATYRTRHVGISIGPGVSHPLRTTPLQLSCAP